MSIEFVKLHGTGNDFVVVPDLNNILEITSEAARLLCAPHFGVGADGAIRVGRPDDRSAPFFMDYRNSDGSIAEMCGNGARAVGKWLGDRGYADSEVALYTRAGVKYLKLIRGEDHKVLEVSVDMGPPRGDVRKQTIETSAGPLDATIVSMGNPHAVIFVDDIDAVDVASLGSEIEHHQEFPEGTNVEFVDNRGASLRQRTWERGVGETLACGTGACAVAVAAVSEGHAKAGTVLPIALRGGLLRLEWTPGESVMMTGPASEVFTGRLDPDRYGIQAR